MVLLYKEEWGEHVKGCKGVRGCLGHPHLGYLPRDVHVPPALASGEGLGGLGVWGRGGPSRGIGLRG